MAEPIRFYFDFSSPYGYFAAEGIEDLAARHGREVAWMPVMLGVIFPKLGIRPLVEVPVKGEYSRRDMNRTARFLGLPFTLPEVFPTRSVMACRAFLWLNRERADLAKRFARGILRAYFAEGRLIDAPETIAGVAVAIGVDPAELAEAIQAPEIKQALFAASEDALAQGVFGSPYFIVDGEPFWGTDRMAQMEQWLAEGGF